MPLSEHSVLATTPITTPEAAALSKRLIKQQIVERFAAFPLLNPDREDHIAAAELRNRCRARGVQAGTIDALLAQLCIRHELTLLTTDVDFDHIAKHTSLEVWSP